MTDRESAAAIRVPLGYEIRVERIRRGWRQDQLAERVGVEARTISHWETGERRISAEAFVSVALALGVSPSQLLERALLRSGLLRRR